MPTPLPSPSDSPLNLSKTREYLAFLEDFIVLAVNVIGGNCNLPAGRGQTKAATSEKRWDRRDGWGNFKIQRPKSKENSSCNIQKGSPIPIQRGGRGVFSPAQLEQPVPQPPPLLRQKPCQTR
jgi:hypothetical protein